MPTENLTWSCSTDGTGLTTCIMPFSQIYNGNVNTFNTPFFSAGEMFISLLLLIGLILSLIVIIKKGIFSVSVHKEYTGVNQMEGKEHYKI